MTDRGEAMALTKMLDDEPGEVPAEYLEASDEMSATTREDIAELAYSYWEARGGQGGSPWEDWFRAEAELKERGEL
jgi:Protein of unknown function (DUF2934)